VKAKKVQISKLRAESSLSIRSRPTDKQLSFCVHTEPPLNPTTSRFNPTRYPDLYFISVLISFSNKLICLATVFHTSFSCGQKSVHSLPSACLLHVQLILLDLITLIPVYSLNYYVVFKIFRFTLLILKCTPATYFTFISHNFLTCSCRQKLPVSEPQKLHFRRPLQCICCQKN
jgi:hypothetical protein